MPPEEYPFSEFRAGRPDRQMENMMMKILSGLGALALITSLSACGGTEESANQGVGNEMNAMMPDSGPFAEAEMGMNGAMMAAVGVNAADSWVRKMIEHHKGAIEMSRIVLAQNPTSEVAQMAQMTIDKQGKEITDLEKLVATGNPDPASAELYRPAATQMHSAMMAATGANNSETYLRKMLAHHQGAVAMSDIALANGATGTVRAQIEKTKSDQQKEIAMVEAMLRGEPMPSAKPAASGPPASAPTAKPTAPKPVAAKPAPAKAKPEPAAEPKAAPPTCLPEHRAAGHC